MKRYLPINSFLAIIFTSLLLCSFARACVCPDTFEGYPACSAFWDANVIFTGRVTEITPPVNTIPGNPQSPIVAGTGHTAHFDVETAYKGVESRKIDVVFDGGDCDYPFEKGKEYFVYANRRPNSSAIVNRSCGRSAPLSRASEDLAYGEALLNGEPKLTLYGSVLRRVDRSTNNGQNFTGVEGIKILIENDSKTTEVLTDKIGRFQLFDLKDGLYTISPEFPENLELLYDVSPRQIKITAPRCSGAVFVTATSDSAP